MKIKISLNVIVLISFFITACGQNNDRSKTIAHISMSTDSLKKILDFPLEIKCCRWELARQGIKSNESLQLVPGANDYILYADIECESSNYKKFESNFINDKGNPLNTDVYLDPAFVRNWFTNDIKLIFYKQGDYLRINVPTYKLSNKIVGKTSFRDGFFSFVGTNKILLVLYR